MTASSRAEPMGVAVKYRLIDGFQNHSDYLLQKLVLKRRDAQRPQFAVPLWDVFPPGGAGLIGSIFQGLDHILHIPIAESVCGIIIDTPGCCALVCIELLIGGEINIFPKQISVEPREYAVWMIGG